MCPALKPLDKKGPTQGGVPRSLRPQLRGRPRIARYSCRIPFDLKFNLLPPAVTGYLPTSISMLIQRHSFFGNDQHRRAQQPYITGEINRASFLELRAFSVISRSIARVRRLFKFDDCLGNRLSCLTVASGEPEFAADRFEHGRSISGRFCFEGLTNQVWSYRHDTEL